MISTPQKSMHHTVRKPMNSTSQKTYEPCTLDHKNLWTLMPKYLWTLQPKNIGPLKPQNLWTLRPENLWTLPKNLWSAHSKKSMNFQAQKSIPYLQAFEDRGLRSMNFLKKYTRECTTSAWRSGRSWPSFRLSQRMRSYRLAFHAQKIYVYT